MPDWGVLQVAPVTRGHAAMWSASGQIMDAGSANGGAPGTTLTELPITNSGLALGIYSDYATASAGYRALTFGFDGSGNGLISLNAFGGQSQTGLKFNINGVTYDVATALAPAGAAIASSLQLTGDGTTGTITGPTGVLHQSQGGVIGLTGNVLQKGDYGWILSADPSLYTNGTVSGTPTATETPGIRYTLGGVNYDFKYTVQPGDTNAIIATGIGTAVYNDYNNNTNGFKTALNNTLDQQSQGVGNPFQTGPSQVVGAVMAFDQPYVGGTTVSALNSAHTTVTLTGNGGGGPKMDGNPVVNITRWYPVGYTLGAGDLGPYLNFQDRIGSGGYSQIGYLNTSYGSAGWNLNLGVAGGAVLTMGTDRITPNVPIALPSTVSITGPSIYAAGNLAVISGGTSGFQVNSNDNGTALATLSNAGALRIFSSVSINGAIPAARQFSAHLGTDQNITMISTASVANLEALNDAGNAFVPLRLAASALSSPAPLTINSGTAIPAGGTAGAGVMVSSTANFGVFFGSGAPTLSAAKGSLYLRSNGSGTTDRAYINTDGGTTWTALTTVA